MTMGISVHLLCGRCLLSAEALSKMRPRPSCSQGHSLHPDKRTGHSCHLYQTHLRFIVLLDVIVTWLVNPCGTLKQSRAFAKKHLHGWWSTAQHFLWSLPLTLWVDITKVMVARSSLHQMTGYGVTRLDWGPISIEDGWLIDTCTV